MSIALSSIVRTAFHKELSIDSPISASKLSTEKVCPVWQRKRKGSASRNCISKRAVAFRAGVGRRLAETHHAAFESRPIFARNRDLDLDLFRHKVVPFFRRRPGEAREMCGDSARGQTVIHIDVAQGVARHRRHDRVKRVLHDRHAAELFDGAKPRGSVVEVAGQNHADDTIAAGVRRRTEQRIDRRTEAVLFRSARDAQIIAALDEQVMIRRRDVDVRVLDALAVERVRRGQATGARQNLRQKAGSGRRGVQHDENRGGQIGGQPRDDLLQRLYAACGRAEYDDVTLRHRGR